MKYLIKWTDTKGNHTEKYDSESERDAKEARLLMKNVLFVHTWNEE